MPNETLRLNLNIDYGVPWKVDGAITGEVHEVLGEIGINVFVVSRTSYVDGVVGVIAEVHPPINIPADQVEAVAQAALARKFAHGHGVPNPAQTTPRRKAAPVTVEKEQTDGDTHGDTDPN